VQHDLDLPALVCIAMQADDAGRGDNGQNENGRQQKPCFEPPSVTIQPGIAERSAASE
jgi:hypothetical protein